MDLFYFVQERLKFIQHLYNSTVYPFEETKRKIEEGKEPYIDWRDPEDVDEPAFLGEWQEADDSIMVVGHWCLCMVQASLQAYLRDCIGRLGSMWWNSDQLVQALSKKKGKSWFGRYHSLFIDELGIDWAKGPVAPSDLEQLNLTRNDLIHNIDVFSLSAERNQEHIERFPRALFTDGLWADVGLESIRVSRENLQRGIDSVANFCRWIDTFRCDYSKYRKHLQG